MTGFYPEGVKEAKNLGKKKKYTIHELKEAAAQGEILEATAYMCDADHNLLVSLGEINGVIPRVEGAVGIAEGRTKEIALISRVGKSVCFTVEEIHMGDHPYALLSRKNAMKRCFDDNPPGELWRLLRHRLWKHSSAPDRLDFGFPYFPPSR